MIRIENETHLGQRALSIPELPEFLALWTDLSYHWCNISTYVMFCYSVGFIHNDPGPHVVNCLGLRQSAEPNVWRNLG